MDDLTKFIVEAKAACYAGGGSPAKPTRNCSHDLTHENGKWSYRDSYFGGVDFLGQEVVWNAGQPVWAMNYYGRVLRDDLISAATAGAVVQMALSALYLEGRFLDGFEMDALGYQYNDETEGNVDSFEGVETILLDDVIVYRLVYHGGIIRV